MIARRRSCVQRVIVRNACKTANKSKRLTTYALSACMLHACTRHTVLQNCLFSSQRRKIVIFIHFQCFSLSSTSLTDILRPDSLGIIIGMYIGMYISQDAGSLASHKMG